MGLLFPKPVFPYTAMMRVLSFSLCTISHDLSLSLSDLDKSGRLSRAGTPSMGVKNTPLGSLPPSVRVSLLSSIF